MQSISSEDDEDNHRIQFDIQKSLYDICQLCTRTENAQFTNLKLPSGSFAASLEEAAPLTFGQQGLPESMMFQKRNQLQIIGQWIS